MNICLECGNNTTNLKFCNSSCSAKFNNRGVRRHGAEPGNCLNCGKKLRSSTGKYCSRACQQSFQENKFLVDWLSGKVSGHYKTANNDLKPAVRRYIFERDGNSCTECGFSGVNPHTGNTILQIDHIDGDSENSSEYNLRTLCPNCHAMTETYGVLNKGNGRPNRHK